MHLGSDLFEEHTTAALADGGNTDTDYVHDFAEAFGEGGGDVHCMDNLRRDIEATAFEALGNWWELPPQDDLQTQVKMFEADKTRLVSMAQRNLDADRGAYTGMSPGSSAE